MKRISDRFLKPHEHGLLTSEEMEETFIKKYREHKSCFQELNRGYMIGGRSFQRGNECLLSAEEFNWLNEKLVERHCMPIDSVPQGYVIEGRPFNMGEEHLLPPEELEWLNEKLVMRYCLPIGHAKTRDDYKDIASNEASILLEKLIPEVIDLFSSEPALAYKDSDSVYVMGELHGDIKALDLILKEFKETDSSCIVFLGGYLSKEYQSLEILNHLFQLKIKWPDRVILLQGRHELAQNSPLYPMEENQQLFALMNRAFEQMPVAAIINGSVFCINSGVPRGLGMDNIKKGDQNRLIEHDPFRYIRLLPPELERDSETFGRDVYKSFTSCNRLKLVVQSHTHVSDGYKWWYDGNLLSLFSSPGQYEHINNGAFALVKNGHLTLFLYDNEEEYRHELFDVVKGPYWSLL